MVVPKTEKSRGRNNSLNAQNRFSNAKRGIIPRLPVQILFNLSY